MMQALGTGTCLVLTTIVIHDLTTGLKSSCPKKSDEHFKAVGRCLIAIVGLTVLGKLFLRIWGVNV